MRFIPAILMLLVIVNPVFSQNLDDNETPETIIQREHFIQERRAGGPGKVLTFDAYSKAMEQKQKITDARQMMDNPFSLIGWVSVNPSGMTYNVTGGDFISGRTNSIAFHPTNANIIYIGAVGGGVWKTTDGGSTWTVLTDGISSIASGDVVVDQTNPNTIYYGTGEANYSLDSKYGDGIFKSTDAGATWNKIATVAQVGSYVAQIAIDPTNSLILYAAGTSGVFKTTNGGTSWTNTGAGTYANCIIIDPTNTQILFTTTGGYFTGVISKSTNGGTSWTTLSTGLPAAGSLGRIQLAMAPSNHLIIYASIASNSSYALLALSKTTDGGTTWATASSSPNPLGSQGWYDNAVTVNPTDPNTVVVAGLDVYVSTNGGTTLVQKSSWSTSTASLFSHADIHRLAYNGTNLYCGSDGGFYKSTNNGTAWTDLNHTISTLQFQGADYDPTNVLKLYGGCQDNDKETSTDGGVTWIQRTTGDGGYTLVDPVNTNFIYSQYVNGTLYRSNNSGVSFSNIKPSGSTGGLFYNPFEMAPSDHNTMIYAQDDVWKTTAAQTASSFAGWSQIATTGTVGGSVSAIGISPLSVNKIYIGTNNGRILVTANNGTSWSVSTGFPYVTDFVVDNVDDNICYASFGGAANNQVYKTTNAGTTWTNITGTLPNISANTLILKTAAQRVLVVGMDAGVYYTSNEGATWIGINTNLPNVQVYDLKYHSSTGLLLAATHGRGVWTFSDAPLPVIIAFFNYDVNQRTVNLRWATQQEINNKGFEIQRKNVSGVSANWINIGFINGHGTTNETEYYTFKDEKLLTAKYEYRLIQNDYNGNIEYYNLGSEVEIGKPSVPEISQNYPNPFNPVTKIDYSLPQDGKVTIIVYDITGRAVSKLVDEVQTAGYYTAEFNATELASGVYFYRISAPGFNKVKKMLVVK